MFCTLRALLKFSVRAVCECHKIMCRSYSSHWWATSECLLHFYFTAATYKSQISLWIYRTMKSYTTFNLRGKRKNGKIIDCRLKSSEPFFVFSLNFNPMWLFCLVLFFFLYSVNKLKRIEFSTASLLKMAPTAEERNIVHDIFLNTLDTRQEGEGWRRTDILRKRKVPFEWLLVTG